MAEDVIPEERKRNKKESIGDVVVNLDRLVSENRKRSVVPDFERPPRGGSGADGQAQGAGNANCG